MRYVFTCSVHGDVEWQRSMKDAHRPVYCNEHVDWGNDCVEPCNEPLTRKFSPTPFIPCAGMYSRGG